MTSPRVHFCNGDQAGWAVDEDLRLTVEAVRPHATVVADPADAEIIHAVWWEPMMHLDAATLRGRRIICHMAGDPVRCWSEPRFLRAMARTSLWIAQSRSALHKLRAVGAHAAFVPYAVDAPVFEASRAESPMVVECREQLRACGRDAYVIANFHRDTEGAGIASGKLAPKLVKGPDVFLEILAELRRRGRNVVALLAGPRRHWLRRELAARAVPFVFPGSPASGDDYPRAILPREELASLYRLADLCLVTSRSEGGPRAVLEAGAASRAVLSSRVGHAPDLLPLECLFDDVVEAVERIEADIDHHTLQRTVPIVGAAVRMKHSVEAASMAWREIYSSIRREKPLDTTSLPVVVPVAKRVIALWNKFTPPPWGGGNQFMLALQAEATRQGVECVQNEAGDRIGAHIVNSVQFDMDRFTREVPPQTARVIHRIDGPISLIRGTPESFDDDRRCFEFNRTYAAATVIQSWHTRRALRELGLEPVRPVIIINSCDPEIFHPPTQPHEPDSRIRLVATSWSPNPGKGAAVYAWLDANLDHSRVCFTFVGNLKGEYRNIQVLPPMASEPLGAFLRTQDIYITASRNDPCSNALLEALASGLPAIYLASGGHPELTEFGGVPFEQPQQLPELIAHVARYRSMYAALARPPSMAEVCRKYLALAFDQDPFRP